MAISKKIISYLDENKFNYEIVEHKTTFTAWDTAQTERVKPQEVAKALVLKLDKDWAVALIPANRNLDKKKLLKTVNDARKKEAKKIDDQKERKKMEKPFKKIEFAKEAWMKKNVPGLVGATPPFGNLLGCEIYMDKLLSKNKKIFVGSGDYTVSIRIAVSQYLKKENPVSGSFSIKK